MSLCSVIIPVYNLAAITRECLDRLLAEPPESCALAAVVGRKLLYPDGTIQHAGMVSDQDGQPQHLYVGFPSDHPAVNKSRRFQMVTGGCFLITREAFDRAKGFDDEFVNGFEDVDLC